MIPPRPIYVYARKGMNGVQKVMYASLVSTLILILCYEVAKEIRYL